MLRVFTLSEVEKHHSRESLYLSVHGNVYDVTKFIDQHPGGQEKLFEAGTSEVTDAFENVFHSQDARELLSTMMIGKLAEADQPKQSTGEPEGDLTSNLTSVTENSSLPLILAFLFLLAAAAYYITYMS